MIKELLAQASPLHLVIFGLLMFWFLFLGIVMWTYRRGAKEKYEEASRIPLMGEE